MQSENINELAAALCKFQGMISNIPKRKKAKIKTKSGHDYSYSYADLADIWDAIRGPLSQTGLCVSQPHSQDGNFLIVITILMHSSGQWIRGESRVPIDGLRTQEIGSLSTYNKRYSLSGILGISADEDEDGALANESYEQKAQKVQKPEPLSDPKDWITESEAAHLESLIVPEDSGFKLWIYNEYSKKENRKIESLYQLPKKYYRDCLFIVENRRKLFPE